MRLIDADELRKIIKEQPVANSKGQLLLAKDGKWVDLLDDMTTVEQKHGHWIIRNYPPNGIGVAICSNCGSIDRDIGIPKFCRICGAKNSIKK